MPGSERSRRSASAAGSATISSSRPPTRAAPRMVAARTPSAPARCHSQDGMAAQVAAGGQTRIPAGAGPGAGRPNRRSSRRQARNASSRPPSAPARPAPAPPAPGRTGRRGRRVPDGQLAQQRVRGPEPGRVVAGAEQAGQRRPAASPRPAPRPARVTGCRPRPDGRSRAAWPGRPGSGRSARWRRPASIRKAGSPRPAAVHADRISGTSTGYGGSHCRERPVAGRRASRCHRRPVTAVRRRSRTGPRSGPAARPARPAGRGAARCPARSAPRRR